MGASHRSGTTTTPKGYASTSTACSPFDLALLNLGAAIDARDEEEKQFRMAGVCVLAAVNCPAHCPHVGKTGGGVYVDVPYESYFDVEY